MYPYWHLGPWIISSYFLLLSIDFCLMICYLRIRSRNRGFDPKMALDVGIISTLLGFLGARLFHVFYESPHYYLENPIAVIKFWNGGYVFLAGVLTALGTGSLWLKLKKQNILTWLDLFAPILALGYALGRWACFLQGCCYGQTSHSFLAMHFESLQNAGETIGRLPTQAFTALGELSLFFVLIGIEKYQPWKTSRGQIFFIWLTGHGINRTIMELMRDDPRGPLLGSMGISFWISLLLILIGGIGSYWSFSQKSSQN